MKRSQPTKSSKVHDKPRIVDARRLAQTRGGADLGIGIAYRPLPEDYMTPQHNEALIRI
jgi:hypothetical protein